MGNSKGVPVQTFVPHLQATLFQLGSWSKPLNAFFVNDTQMKVCFCYVHIGYHPQIISLFICDPLANGQSQQRLGPDPIQLSSADVAMHRCSAKPVPM